MLVVRGAGAFFTAVTNISLIMQTPPEGGATPDQRTSQGGTVIIPRGPRQRKRRIGGWRMSAGGWRMSAGGWRMSAGGWRMSAGG